MEGNEQQAGNKYSDLVNLYSERVFNLALKMLGAREDAEEATQDVFMRVIKSLDNFRGDSSLSTWIWRITANVCISRRKKRRNDSVSLDQTRFDPPDGKIDTYSRQESAMYRNELSGIVNKYVSMLPSNESAAITLFYLEGLSYEEISEILEMPVGTVSIALHRGRKRLREMLSKLKELL